MEIHAPEGRIDSWKAFALHIGIVTAGILIALALDSAVEWRHNRHLVREARDYLDREMAHNAEEVGRFLAIVKNTEADYETVGTIVNDLRQHRNNTHGYRFRAYTMQLSEAAWTTAQSSGAVTHMDYLEIQQYASIYATQSRLAMLQDRFLEAALAATPDADPSSWSEMRFDSWKQQAAAADTHARAEEHVAMHLVDEIKKARDLNAR